MQKKPIYKDVLDSFDETKKQSLYVTVLIPILIEFVSWVLEEATNRGIKRLYFLARDGYQMYLVAEKLCQIKQIPIDCRYLKVSRYAMRTPEYHLLKDRCVDYICTGGIDVTLERIMKRAGLTESQAEQYLPEQDAKSILNYQEVMGLRDTLRNNQQFLESVYKCSKEQYEPTIAYLRQEGLFEDIKYALVDSGWVGTLQKSIAHLVERPDLEGFYFGIYETPKDIDADRYHAFYFGQKWGLHRKVGFSNCLFEAIFTSPEGMTLRYRKQGDKYVPVTDFAENPNKALIEENCQCLAEYMNIYAKLLHNYEITQNVEKPNNYKARLKFIKALLSKFMGEPTTLEVGSFGDLLFSDDVLEGNLKKVAADLTAAEIHTQRFLNKAFIMLGIKKEEIHESAWIEGSIVKEGRHISQNLFHAKVYKYFVYIRKMVK